MRVKIILVFWLLLPVVLFSQAGQGPVMERPVPESKWEQASGALDYSRDVPRPSREQPPPPADAPAPSMPNPSIDTQLLGNIAQILAILLAVAAIGYGIYRMLQEPSNKRVARDGAVITVDNLETYLHETDLDHFLREALAKGDFALAIRIYYLQTIKQLSHTGSIHWSREKTNRDYLREMRSDPDYHSFQHLTRVFERAWYGNMPVQQTEFSALEPEFKKFISRRATASRAFAPAGNGPVSPS